MTLCDSNPTKLLYDSTIDILASAGPFAKYRKIIHDESIKMCNNHINLFLFLSSGPRGSSSSLSTVSAGLSKECTLLAMLDRLVCGAESRCLGGNFDGAPKDQPLSPLNADGVVSLVSGGVA